MCTIVVLLRPGHRWPLLLAANRDEMLNRPWLPPARHWSDRPEIVAGLDELAQGSWLGINKHGVVAAILNRRNSLGPAPGKRSRGELVLEALDHADAAEAARALAGLEPAAYRSFNMVIADNAGAYWLRHQGGAGAADGIERFALPAGLSMITAFDRNDMTSVRIARFLPRFEAAQTPDPERGDWREWIALLSDRGKEGRESDGQSAQRESAMCVVTDFGFGTSSSSLIALPAPQVPARQPIWLFSPGPPNVAAYEPIDLAALA
jgi:hypothetical protein